MGNKMKKCKLFLALGEEQELQDGYGKIGAYIHRLNRTYRANGLQLQLIPYGAKEGSFLSGGAAVDVHKEVQDCEIALFLFYRDVPEALKEELQEVYALFQKAENFDLFPPGGGRRGRRRRRSAGKAARLHRLGYPSLL